MVYGLEFGDKGLWSMVSDLGCMVQGSWFQVWGPCTPTPPCCLLSRFGFGFQGFLVSGLAFMVYGLWFMVYGYG